MHIWVPFFWTRRILGCWGWRPSGTLSKEQGSYNPVQYWGHRGPVLRPRCIRPGGARTPFIFLFYSILHHLVVYLYFSLSPFISGISQAWLLVLLSVVHSGDSNLKLFLNNELQSCCHNFLNESLFWKFYDSKDLKNICTTLNFCSLV